MKYIGRINKDGSIKGRKRSVEEIDLEIEYLLQLEKEYDYMEELEKVVYENSYEKCGSVDYFLDII